MSREQDQLLRYFLVGDSKVGKSSLLLRFADQSFVESYLPTIGVDFKIRALDVDGQDVRLQVWDTSGDERFRVISSSAYYRCDGVIIVYDTTNIESFEHIQKWLSDVERRHPNGVLKLLVGNKCDLISERAVAYKQVKELADNLEIPYIETSAKDDVNVQNIFVTMTRTNRAALKEQQTLTQSPV